MSAVTDSMAERTGRALDEWVALVAASGVEPLDQNAVRRWLREVHGVKQNSQWAIADAAALAAGWVRPSVEDYIDGQFAGEKAALRPVFDAVRARRDRRSATTSPSEGRGTFVPFVRRPPVRGHGDGDVRPARPRPAIPRPAGQRAAHARERARARRPTGWRCTRRPTSTTRSAPPPRRLRAGTGEGDGHTGPRARPSRRGPTGGAGPCSGSASGSWPSGSARSRCPRVRRHVDLPGRPVRVPAGRGRRRVRRDPRAGHPAHPPTHGPAGRRGARRRRPPAAVHARGPALAVVADRVAAAAWTAAAVWETRRSGG